MVNRSQGSWFLVSLAIAIEPGFEPGVRDSFQTGTISDCWLLFGGKRFGARTAVMDQGDDPRDIERKIEQASRIASRLTDPTTYERLTAWVEELKQRLQKLRAAMRSREEIRARAHEIWEHNGRPVGRDEEFWLQAESEIREGRNE